MKKQNIILSVLSVACLVACGDKQDKVSDDNNGNNTSTNPIDGANNQDTNTNDSNSKFVIEKFGTTRFEAEKFGLSKWNAEGSDKIVDEAKASGGKYLAAAQAGSTATFSFTLQAYSKVVFSAAYAQTEDNIANEVNLGNTFAYHIDAINDFRIGSNNKLAARSSATSFELVSYEEESLYPGEYKVTLEVLEDAENVPSIDFIQFKTSDASIEPADVSGITSVPDNDMRNLQQYKFLNESDLLQYKTYATGADLSAPEGIKLRFDDVETASKYYVQVATSEADLENAPVREATEKVYKFQNALLGTKYYYRAATSIDGLASATVKNITTTSVAPRVVYVPDVLNFRDIGGWESDLVPGGKINQGMYFRCAQLDAGRGGNTTSKLDNAGKGKAAIKELGIKVDIDMRDSYNFPSNKVSAANSTEWPVQFVAADVASGTESKRWEGGDGIAAKYKIIFDTIAHCDTDPVMLHCTYGADRTGITTFFLEALLGMSEEDMTRDYLWTQFTQGRDVKIEESKGAEFPQWVKKTKACEGTTFADKMENHLISFGIEKSTLEHIREIFVPGYVAKA
ncbi:MAG: tyrosine-protein phosphatase [Bacilli bacterium]|nr:tyrosine-protein phosphatase [Bacilli bacterium]